MLFINLNYVVDIDVTTYQKKSTSNQQSFIAPQHFIRHKIKIVAHIK